MHSWQLVDKTCREFSLTLKLTGILRPHPYGTMMVMGIINKAHSLLAKAHLKHTSYIHHAVNCLKIVTN